MTRPVVCVVEYGRIGCGATCNPDEKVLDERQFTALENFNDLLEKRHGFRAFLPGTRRTLVAQNFVGIVDLGSVQVEILPKIDDELTTIRHNLVKMIAIAEEIETASQGSTTVHDSVDSILEVLIRLFCEEVWRLIRGGFVRRYESASDNLTVVRGRVSAIDQMRRNLGRPDRLACVFDEFTGDNLLNRVIRLALSTLMGVSRSQSNRSSLSELLFCFADVSEITESSIDWHRVSTDRLTSRWSPALAFAKLVILGRSPDVNSGGSSGYALLFDMNVLFERYVGAMAKRVLRAKGLRVSLQGPQRHLTSSTAGTPAFSLKPDIVVFEGDAVLLVIDTKWKRLKQEAARESVASADMYQMYAYAKRYFAPHVFLMYPHHHELGNWVPERASYTTQELAGTSHSKISVATVDLRDLSLVPSQLLSITEAAVKFASFHGSRFQLNQMEANAKRQEVLYT